MAYFSHDTAAFLKALKANNNREWFSANKRIYEQAVKAPAEAFCGAMAQALQGLTGDAHKSKLYRIYRDVRFSKDKTPYNAHVHISFTPEGKSASPPSWFFGLEPDRLILGAGVFAFDKQALESFRQCVSRPSGEALDKVLKKLRKEGYTLGEPELKRTPAGYPADHPRAELSRRKGLAVWFDFQDTAPAVEGDIVEMCLQRFQPLRPVYDWIRSNISAS